MQQKKALEYFLKLYSSGYEQLDNDNTQEWVCTVYNLN